MERKRIGLVHNLNLPCDNFNLAGRDLGVGRSATADLPSDPQAILIAHVSSDCNDLGIALDTIFRLSDDLDDSFMVSKIDEAQTAKIARHVDPSAQGDVLPDETFINETTKMATHN